MDETREWYKSYNPHVKLRPFLASSGRRPVRPTSRAFAVKVAAGSRFAATFTANALPRSRTSTSTLVEE